MRREQRPGVESKHREDFVSAEAGLLTADCNKAGKLCWQSPFMLEKTSNRTLRAFIHVEFELVDELIGLEAGVLRTSVWLLREHTLLTCTWRLAEAHAGELTAQNAQRLCSRAGLPDLPTRQIAKLLEKYHQRHNGVLSRRFQKTYWERKQRFNAYPAHAARLLSVAIFTQFPSLEFASWPVAEGRSEQFLRASRSAKAFIYTLPGAPCFVQLVTDASSEEQRYQKTIYGDQYILV